MDSELFSSDYRTARTRFRQAAAAVGAACETLKLNARGPQDQDLTIDIAVLGATAPQHALVHISGVHGIEGFAGSAIQLKILGSPPRLADTDAIILVHGVNPFGMAWLRRVNENNVDLNRNFLAAGEAYEGAPEGYQLQNRLLNPASPPQRMDLFCARILWYILRLGFAKWKDSVAGGQYQYPKGLFYGGRRLEQGPSLLLDWLRAALQAVTRLGVVDVHTGLGPFGVDSLIVSYLSTSEKYNRLKGQLGERLIALDPHGIAYRARGISTQAMDREFPRAESWSIAQEFGTLPIFPVLRALRDENRLFHYGDPAALDHTVKQRFWGLFCPGDERWRQTVVARGQQLVLDVLRLVLVGN